MVGEHSISLHCQMLDNKFEWLFTGVYAPCTTRTEERKEFWREIEEVRAYWNHLPWVIGGDFNVTRYSHERTSEGDITGDMRKFNRFISLHELVDLPLMGATYTWTNNQIQSIRSRIDRIMVSPAWELQYPKVIQQALPRPCSDHNPIALICNGVKKGPDPFRSEVFWFSHPDFIQFVKNVWDSCFVAGNEDSAGFIFCKKLKFLKIELKKWSIREFGDLERRIDELEQTFNDLDMEEDLNNGLTQEQWDERLKPRQEHCKLIILKEEKWRCRARVNHIRNNEYNTKYFHRIATDRMRRSYIGSIRVDGNLTSDEKMIKEGIVNYFQSIFQNQPMRVFNMENMQLKKISMQQRDWLESEVSEEECLKAIKALGQNKAPGPDGFQISFYTTCWEVIKKDLLNIISELQHENFLDWRLKNTFIALIPKKDTIEEIKDLRPISLVHGVYKIISKVLTERLKLVLPGIISQQQTTFIKKRQILDGVLIANELIDSRCRSGNPGLLVKVDFEKAFDHVSWDFIDEIMLMMGFGVKWRKWMRCCMEYVKFSILINGSAIGFFTSKKGIRQGDPLSPFLFLFVGEALSYMITKAQQEGLISGFQVNENGSYISHLQFADDTLIFIDADVNQVQHLRLILLSFELLTGLKINFAKSCIFGVGFDGDLTQFSMLLGCSVGCLPTSYLGLPLGDKCGGYAKWDRVVEKFTIKLAGWKKTLLSKAGKLTLINSVLSSLPVYYMSLFVIPMPVVRRLEKLMRDFLWSDNNGRKKMHLLRWDLLYKKKKSGGLGIKSLKRMNNALLGKWLWRFANEKDALWREIIVEKYGVDTVNWLSKYPKSSYGRAVWRGIMNCKEEFLKHVKFKVNSGIQVRFWHDTWLLDTNLSTAYPNLFSVCRSKDLFVAENGVITWDLKLPRRLNITARGEWMLLQTDLHDVQLDSTTEDVLQWGPII